MPLVSKSEEYLISNCGTMNNKTSTPQYIGVTKRIHGFLWKEWEEREIMYQHYYYILYYVFKSESHTTTETIALRLVSFNALSDTHIQFRLVLFKFRIKFNTYLHSITEDKSTDTLLYIENSTFKPLTQFTVVQET